MKRLALPLVGAAIALAILGGETYDHRHQDAKITIKFNDTSLTLHDAPPADAQLSNGIYWRRNGGGLQMWGNAYCGNGWYAIRTLLPPAAQGASWYDYKCPYDG